MQNTSLRKSVTDKKLAGVCGGIAEYTGLDPTLIRLIWLALTAAGGSGIMLYIAAMLLIPD